MRRRNRAVAVLVLVSLILLIVDLRDGGGVLQRGATALFAPVQAAGAAIVRPIGGFFSSIGDLGSLREENQRLREENGELRQSAVSVADLERENTDLRALLGAAQEEELVTTVGRVIATPPDDTSWSVLIDCGAEQGVAVGMAVMTEAGFLGRVSEVTDAVRPRAAGLQPRRGLRRAGGDQRAGGPAVGSGQRAVPPGDVQQRRRGAAGRRDRHPGLPGHAHPRRPARRGAGTSSERHHRRRAVPRGAALRRLRLAHRRAGGPA